MTVPTLPAPGASPVERVMNLLIAAGFVVGADWATSTVTVGSRPVSLDTSVHWLVAINASGWTRDDRTLRGTTLDGVTVVIPTRPDAPVTTLAAVTE